MRKIEAIRDARPETPVVQSSGGVPSGQTHGEDAPMDKWPSTLDLIDIRNASSLFSTEMNSRSGRRSVNTRKPLLTQ